MSFVLRKWRILVPVLRILRIIEGLDKDKRVYVEIERARHITGLERLYRNNTRREIKIIPLEFNVGKSTVWLNN